MPVKGKSNRDKYADELPPMMHGYGALLRTVPTVNPRNRQIPIVRSEADTIFILNGGGTIETKTGYNVTFQMGSEPRVGPGWRQDQIEWAIDYRKRTNCEYWLFVVYETDETPWVTMLQRPSKDKKPRDAFLVPFHAAYEVMQMLPQKSLPYKVRKHMNTEMQENNWDALNLWKEYRLDWKSGWKVPVTHTFHQLYISPTPRAITTTIESIDLGELQHEYSNV